MRILMRNGWPDMLLADGQETPEGSTVREFATWAEVNAAKAAFEAKQPPPPLPPPPVPASVELWKFRTACQQRGILDQIAAWIAAQPEPPRIALTAFMEYGTDVPRDSETVEQIAKALGKSDADIDALFIAANSIDIA